MFEFTGISDSYNARDRFLDFVIPMSTKLSFTVSSAEELKNFQRFVLIRVFLKNFLNKICCLIHVAVVSLDKIHSSHFGPRASTRAA